MKKEDIKRKEILQQKNALWEIYWKQCKKLLPNKVFDNAAKRVKFIDYFLEHWKNALQEETTGEDLAMEALFALDYIKKQKD